MPSISGAFEIDPSSLVPLHEQVAAAIRRAIADDEARPGERLPPARDLAAVLGVNANTVLRALRTLRDEGLLEFRRGRGVSDEQLDAALHALRCLPTGRWRRCVVYPLVVLSTDRAFHGPTTISL